MLGARAKATDQQKSEERDKGPRRAQAEEADRREERPEGENAGLAPALGQKACGHLEESSK